MKFKNLASVLLSFFILVSCKKDKAVNCERTTENLAGTYILVKGEIGSNNNFNEIDLRNACEKDDQYILNTDGTVNYKDAGTTCEPIGDENGTWSLNAAGKISLVAGYAMIAEGEVTSFDCSNLVITTSVSGIQYRFTFKK